MHTIYFEGAMEIKKPDNVRDEECSSAYAKRVEFVQKMEDGSEYLNQMWVEHLMPNKEDIQAINEGRGIWIQLHCGQRLIPIAVFTLDEKGEPND